MSYRYRKHFRGSFLQIFVMSIFFKLEWTLLWVQFKMFCTLTPSIWSYLCLSYVLMKFSQLLITYLSHGKYICLKFHNEFFECVFLVYLSHIAHLFCFCSVWFKIFTIYLKYKFITQLLEIYECSDTKSIGFSPKNCALHCTRYTVTLERNVV